MEAPLNEKLSDRADFLQIIPVQYQLASELLNGVEVRIIDEPAYGVDFAEYISESAHRDAIFLIDV